ncbi:hypothetical protein ENBRE01_1279 [Enteropsectra breve]|nr:hypothetical protein ENBRE01_1279 [Enteropsectra breve]
MKKKISKDIAKLQEEINEYIEEEKPAKTKINFAKHQLRYLKADVKKPQYGFKNSLRIIDERKERRKAAVARRQELGIARRMYKR